MSKTPSERHTTNEERPLSASNLRNADIDVPRHRYGAQPTTIRSVEATTLKKGELPTISTRLVPIGKAGRNQRWRVEIEISGAEMSGMHPPAIKPVTIERAVLAKSKTEVITPSMPDDGKVLAKRPKRIKKPEPFMIRFGDLRYRPTTIFPPDGRKVYYDTRYPWRCLLRITTPRGWSGSGVLIGPRHVLTASHCVDWTPGWLNVDVLYSNNNSLSTSGAWLVYAESKVSPGSISDSESDEDYAVLVLNDRIGDRFGWLGCRTYDSSWDDETSYWWSVGYPQDMSMTGQLACYQTDFLLNELGWDLGSARLIRSSTFDNWPGQSGSPVFGFWDNGPYVVGVVSGENESHNHISGGSLLTSLVSRARSEHP